MGLLQVIEDAPGYVKATFQGPQGSGKTRTAVELACKTHQFFASKKPIAFYDTETGSDYVRDLIVERIGIKPIRVKTRAFSDLRDVVRECANGAADVLIVDSITHVWREIQDAYMEKINEGRRYAKKRMDIGDIMQVRKLWEPWPDDFLNAPIHIIVCGREGNEWGNEENEETGKRELVQVGKKMKVESEFGYEASLMVAMTLEQVSAATIRKRDKTVEKRVRRFVNVATVLKDRFDVMNGQAFEFPTGDTFLPFLERLNPKAHATMPTDVRSHGTMPPLSDDGWTQEKKDRAIACEEVQAELLSKFPSMSAEHKYAKATLIKRCFGTGSWTKVESMPAVQIKNGLADLRRILADADALAEALNQEAVTNG